MYVACVLHSYVRIHRVFGACCMCLQHTWLLQLLFLMCSSCHVLFSAPHFLHTQYLVWCVGCMWGTLPSARVQH